MKALITVWNVFLIALLIVFLTMRWTGYISWPAWKYWSPGILWLYNFVLGVSYIAMFEEEKRKKGQ